MAPRWCGMRAAWQIVCGRVDGDSRRDVARPAARRPGTRPHRGKSPPCRTARRRNLFHTGSERSGFGAGIRAANNFSHIVIAKSRRSRWSEWLRGSVTHQLIRYAGDISIHVIAEGPSSNRRGRLYRETRWRQTGCGPTTHCLSDRGWFCCRRARPRPDPSAISSGFQHCAGLSNRGAGQRHHRSGCGRRCSPV